MTKNIAKNTLYLTLAQVGQKVLAFVYFIFLARVMQPESTGAYFLTLSITMMFSIVAEFGINSVVIREVAKAPNKAKRWVKNALGLKLPLMVAAVVLANGAAHVMGYPERVQLLVLIASLSLVGDSIAAFFYGALRGLQKLKYEAVGQFVAKSIVVTLGGLVLVFAPSLSLLVLILFAGSLFNIGYATYNLVKETDHEILFPSWSGEWASKIFRIAVPFALAGLFVKVYSYTDSLLLGKFLGETAVGVYSVAYKFTYAFQFLPMAFVAALYPGLSAILKKDKTKVQKTFQDALWYMMLAVTPIVLGIFAIAPDIVGLTGEGYGASVPVLQALIFVLFPLFLDFPIGSLLNAADRQVTKTTIMGVAMVINVALNLALIPVIGVMGAAYAALVSFTVMFLIGAYYVPQIIPGFSFWETAKQLFPILVSGLVMLGVALALQPVMSYILVIPVAAVVYVAMLFMTKAFKMRHVVKIKNILFNIEQGYVEDAQSVTHDD